MRTAPATYLFVFRRPAGQPDASPAEMQQSFQKWMAWIQALRARGQYLAGEPLEDAPAQLLRGPRGSKVLAGPLVEAREVVCGYLLIAADSFDEAAAIARDCPIYDRAGSTEVRQVMPGSHRPAAK